MSEEEVTPEEETPEEEAEVEYSTLGIFPTITVDSADFDQTQQDIAEASPWIGLGVVTDLSPYTGIEAEYMGAASIHTSPIAPD